MLTIAVPAPSPPPLLLVVVVGGVDTPGDEAGPVPPEVIVCIDTPPPGLLVVGDTLAVGVLMLVEAGGVEITVVTYAGRVAPASPAPGAVVVPVTELSSWHSVTM